MCGLNHIRRPSTTLPSSDHITPVMWQGAVMKPSDVKDMQYKNSPAKRQGMWNKNTDTADNMTDTLSRSLCNNMATIWPQQGDNNMRPAS